MTTGKPNVELCEKMEILARLSQNIHPKFHGRTIISAIYDKSYHYGDEEIIKWSRQAASALIFLHNKESIHRDIKPAK